MATLEIELQPDEQARLQQEAETEGLGLEDWARRRLLDPVLLGISAPAPGNDVPAAKPLWEIIAELDSVQIPAEDRARVPHDGSINYKHYLYGAPKVDVPEDAA